MTSRQLVPSPAQVQSIAALLPAEIVDCIFSHFDFNYLIEAAFYERAERNRMLSNMSVVAESWKGPARRLLFRNVRIRSWEHLQEKVEDWAGGEVRRLDIDFQQRWSTDPQEVAKAVFELLKKVPNLR